MNTIIRLQALFASNLLNQNSVLCQTHEKKSLNGKVGVGFIIQGLEGLGQQYFYISSIMTNSRPVAGFLLIVDSPELAGKIPFFLGENIIGRSQTKATLVIKHAKLYVSAKKVTLTDLGSKNGTKINNEDNFVQPQKQVQIDESMVVYFAEVKCRIEILKKEDNQTNKLQAQIKEKEKRRAELLKKMKEEQSIKQPKQQKAPKDQFQKIAFIGDIDLEGEFAGELKKVQKVGKKKNTKASKLLPQANVAQKSLLEEKPKINMQDQLKQKQKKAKNKDKKIEEKGQETKQIIKERQKVLPSERLKNIKPKQPQKQSVSPSKETKSKPKERSPKFSQKNIKKEIQMQKQNVSKLIEPKKKILRTSNEREQQRKQSNKQKKSSKDKVSKKQVNFSKQQRELNKSKEEPKVQPKISKKSKEKNKLNQTMLEKDKQKPQLSMLIDDQITNTTKKKLSSRKKMPSESLEKELRQSARRSTVGKRILFSGFVPKMRRKFFTTVQDYTQDFDYLIMKEYTRTFKALVAISKGIPIIKNTWIEDSQQCQRTLNPNHYRFSKLQHVYNAIEKASSGEKLLKGYDFYLVSAEYHLKTQQIQTLIKLGGGEIKVLKSQTKLKDPRKGIAILRNRKEDEGISPELKDQILRAKKQGFELIYAIQFLLEACERQHLDWENNKLTELRA